MSSFSSADAPLRSSCAATAVRGVEGSALANRTVAQSWKPVPNQLLTPDYAFAAVMGRFPAPSGKQQSEFVVTARNLVKTLHHCHR